MPTESIWNRRLPRRAIFKAPFVLGVTPVGVMNRDIFGSNPQNHPSLRLRNVKEANLTCQRSREQNNVNLRPISPLEKFLNTDIRNRIIGATNYHLIDSSEDDLGHFRFPIDPKIATIQCGKDLIVPPANNKTFASFRKSGNIDEEMKKIYDRAVWAMHHGRHGMAVIELDGRFSDNHYQTIVSNLAYIGVKTIAVGNETNDPAAKWRNNPRQIFEVSRIIRQELNNLGRTDINLSLPGLAYFGDGKHLEDLGNYFNDMLAKLLDLTMQSTELPVNVVSDHFYGSVDKIRPRISEIRQSMKGVGLERLKYYLSEVGNPAANFQDKVNPKILAECYTPQVLASALSTRLVDRIYYYALHDGAEPEHSLSGFKDGKLIPNENYFAFRVASSLYANLARLDYSENPNGSVTVYGERTDNIKFLSIWSNLDDQQLEMPIPQNSRVFNAFGEELLDETRLTKAVLLPKPKPYLAGPIKHVILT